MKKIKLLAITAFTVSVMFILFTNFQSQRPDQIIMAAIEQHGGLGYNRMAVQFDFRDKYYTIIRDRGNFRYSRTWQKNLETIKDMLTNEGFRRWRNGVALNLSKKDQQRISESLNSVIYFALLPFGLNDPAVKMQYLGTVDLQGKLYDKIEITFRKDGGGVDYKDRFVYWFGRDSHRMDFLAYRFHVNGGGTRFRAARNFRRVNEILFADYDNYKGPDDRLDIENFDQLFGRKLLKKISEINLKNIRVGSNNLK